MATTKGKVATIDAYLTRQPPEVQKKLKQVRGIIRKAVPDATEVISYQIPAYRLPQGMVVFFAGWKHHFSLYPASKTVVEALKDELEPYVVSKGTIRFPLEERVPVKLIERIAKLRAREVRAK